MFAKFIFIDQLFWLPALSNCKQRPNNDAEEDGEDEEEELMLRQAIALSLEGAEENDQEKSALGKVSKKNNRFF